MFLSKEDDSDSDVPYVQMPETAENVNRNSPEFAHLHLVAKWKRQCRAQQIFFLEKGRAAGLKFLWCKCFENIVTGFAILSIVLFELRHNVNYHYALVSLFFIFHLCVNFRDLIEFKTKSFRYYETASKYEQLIRYIEHVYSISEKDRPQFFLDHIELTMQFIYESSLK